MADASRPSVSVGDLCLRTTSGGTPSRAHPEYYLRRGIPWIKTQELADCVLYDAEEHISEVALRESSAKLLPPSTVLVAMYGATAGQLGYLGREMACNQACCALIVDSERCDSRFLFYALRAERSRLKSLANGAAQQNLSVRTIAALEIGVPPLAEQRAIAEVLGALDDKIDANRRVARFLEQRLSAMFLQFGLDELGESGKDVVTLCEIIEVNPPRKKIGLEIAPYIDMAALPTDSALVAEPAFRKPKSGVRFVNGDTLMARITPCLENGKVAFVDCLASTEVGTGSTEFLVLRPREPLPAEFAYFLARSERFSAYAVQHMSGSSGRQRCPAEAIERYKIARPDVNELVSFGDLAGPAFAMMRATVNESVVLADLRDTLLPKLMSGELRVRDAEHLVEDAV